MLLLSIDRPRKEAVPIAISIMQIDERSFFGESDDQWIFERILHLNVHCPDPDISFVAIEKENAESALPRSLAVAYSLYLSMVAKRTDLAERIWKNFPEAQNGTVRDVHLVFVQQRHELYIRVSGLFKCCPLDRFLQWFPEIVCTLATPRHLTLFTPDVLLAIEDEAMLRWLFRRLPMLWLPTSATVIGSSVQGAAHRVAFRQRRLLTARQ